MATVGPILATALPVPPSFAPQSMSTIPPRDGSGSTFQRTGSGILPQVGGAATYQHPYAHPAPAGFAHPVSHLASSSPFPPNSQSYLPMPPNGQYYPSNPSSSHTSLSQNPPSRTTSGGDWNPQAGPSSYRRPAESQRQIEHEDGRVGVDDPCEFHQI